MFICKWNKDKKKHIKYNLLQPIDSTKRMSIFDKFWFHVGQTFDVWLSTIIAGST